jgi:hypothetical protein
MKINIKSSFNRIRKRTPKPGTIIPDKKKESNKKFCRQKNKMQG